MAVTRKRSGPNEGDAEQPANRRLRPSSTSDMIHLLVGSGPGTKTFVLRRNIICEHSELAQRACEIHTAGDVIHISLPEVSAEAFDVYCVYLMSDHGALLAEHGLRAAEKGENAFAGRSSKLWGTAGGLCQLWLAARLVEDEACRNAVMDQILELEWPKGTNMYATTNMAIVTWADARSGLWRWAVDHAAMRASERAQTSNAPESWCT